MEWLAGWAKNLIFLVIFAAFLELLLPSNQMQKFLRVIVGLLVMMTVLQPIMEILEKRSTPVDLPVFQTAGSIDQRGKESDEHLAKNLQRQAFCKELSRQVEATVSALAGVVEARVQVLPEDDETFVKRVMIQVRTEAGINRVKPVDLQAKENPAAEELNSDLKNKILCTVTQLYQLPAEKIVVKKG